MSFFSRSHQWLKPWLWLPPETAHASAVFALRHGLWPKPVIEDYPRLRTEIAGLSLPNPIGLAAGFDKNARSLPHLFDYGFGWAECGTITPRSQQGNPRPRLFRLPEEEAVINRLGFNNRGVESALIGLRERNKNSGIVGANLGKNKDSDDALSDYVLVARAVYPHVDYLTANLSSPNTPGLRDLQQTKPFTQMVEALHRIRSEHMQQGHGYKPIFFKLAPDLSGEDAEALAEAALALSADGLILTNTTITRPDNFPQWAKDESGGLSGVPLMHSSTSLLRRFYHLTQGRIPLIGVGGISSAEDVYAKLKAGASAVQLYTALVYHGPGLVARLLAGLDQLLAADGVASISEIIGTD